MWKISSFVWLEKCLFFCEVFHCFPKTRNAQVAFAEKPQIKKQHWYIIWLYLIRQNFQGYRCELGIAIFARRVSRNYAFIPFRKSSAFSNHFVFSSQLIQKDILCDWFIEIEYIYHQENHLLSLVRSISFLEYIYLNIYDACFQNIIFLILFLWFLI